MEKKASKQTPTFETEADFLDEISHVKTEMNKMFSENENLEKYQIQVGDILRFCETNYHKNVLFFKKF